MKHLDSVRNERVKGWRKLHTKKGRRESGRFLAEGPHLVEEALGAGAGWVEAVIASREWHAAARVPGGIERVSASDEVLRALSETRAPQGVLAVCRLPGRGAPIADPVPRRVLLADTVQDPGHAGTLIRTAHAAGLKAVVLGTDCAEAFSGKALRAAQGSTFHVPVFEDADLGAWIGALRGARVRVFGSAVDKNARDYRSIEPPGAFGLLVGNEAAGVRAELLEQCDECVRIRMPGGAESLSLPVATGVLVFWMIGNHEGHQGHED